MSLVHGGASATGANGHDDSVLLIESLTRRSLSQQNALKPSVGQPSWYSDINKVYIHSCAGCWSPVSLESMHFQRDCQSGNKTVNYIRRQKNGQITEMLGQLCTKTFMLSIQRNYITKNNQYDNTNNLYGQQQVKTNKYCTFPHTTTIADTKTDQRFTIILNVKNDLWYVNNLHWCSLTEMAAVG